MSKELAMSFVMQGMATRHDYTDALNKIVATYDVSEFDFIEHLCELMAEDLHEYLEADLPFDFVPKTDKCYDACTKIGNAIVEFVIQTKGRVPMQHHWNLMFYITIAQQYAEKHGQEMSFASTYGEPGYSDPTSGILFSNWNNWPSNLMERMEAAGFELKRSDEWVTQGDRAYRSQPDSYSWERSYLVDEGEIITIHDDPEQWYEATCITDIGQPFQGVIHSGLPRLSHWVYLDEPEYESGFTRSDEKEFEDQIHHLFDSGKAEKVCILKSEQSQFYCKYTIAYLPAN